MGCESQYVRKYKGVRTLSARFPAHLADAVEQVGHPSDEASRSRAAALCQSDAMVQKASASESAASNAGKPHGDVDAFASQLWPALLGSATRYHEGQQDLTSRYQGHDTARRWPCKVESEQRIVEADVASFPPSEQRSVAHASVQQASQQLLWRNIRITYHGSCGYTARPEQEAGYGDLVVGEAVESCDLVGHAVNH